MPIQVICSSHAHLTDYEELAVADEIRREVDANVEKHRQLIADFNPDLVIKIGDDHASGFGLSLMPPFTVGVRAHAIGDFKCSKGPLSTDEPRARALIAALHNQGIDVSYSYNMAVDHGVVQLLDHYFGGVDQIPCIPIVINCGGDIRPPLHRTRALGEGIGRFVKEQLDDLNVTIIGSGGLSHDPPLPVFLESPPEVQQRMIDGPPEWTDEVMAERVERVVRFAREHAEGSDELLPLNREWDEHVLTLMVNRDLDTLCAMDEQEMIAVAGRGAAEIRNWIAPLAAIDAYTGGHYEAVKDYYCDIPAWIVGMGQLHAHPV